MSRVRLSVRLAVVLVAAAFSVPASAQVSSNIAQQVVPVIQNAAYASGNAVGSLQTVQAFRSPATPTGIFNGLSLGWIGTETTPLTFYIFDKNPTASTCTDKTAFSLAAADNTKLAFAPFTLTAAAPSVGTTSTFADFVYVRSVQNHDTPTTANLYICAVTGGTFTPAVGDLNYRVEVAVD